MDLKINLLKKNKISPYPFFRLLDFYQSLILFLKTKEKDTYKNYINQDIVLVFHVQLYLYKNYMNI